MSRPKSQKLNVESLVASAHEVYTKATGPHYQRLAKAQIAVRDTISSIPDDVGADEAAMVVVVGFATGWWQYLQSHPSAYQQGLQYLSEHT